jgi:hypothetical protein
VTSDCCAAARPSSTSLMLRGWTSARGRDVGRTEEHMSSWLTIGAEQKGEWTAGNDLDSEIDEHANECSNRAGGEKIQRSRWYELKRQ